MYEIVDEGKAPFFRGVDRIKLMKSIFENNISEGGAGLNIQKMLDSCKSHLLAIFPLHDYSELSALQNEWLILYEWPSRQPFTKIRYVRITQYISVDTCFYFTMLNKYAQLYALYAIFFNRNYFGEKLALFYVFLGHYTTMLGYPSIIGKHVVKFARSYLVV